LPSLLSWGTGVAMLRYILTALADAYCPTSWTAVPLRDTVPSSSLFLHFSFCVYLCLSLFLYVCIRYGQFLPAWTLFLSKNYRNIVLGIMYLPTTYTIAMTGNTAICLKSNSSFYLISNLTMDLRSWHYCTCHFSND
jgi:hypothetical protein